MKSIGRILRGARCPCGLEAGLTTAAICLESRVAKLMSGSDCVLAQRGLILLVLSHLLRMRKPPWDHSISQFWLTRS